MRKACSVALLAAISVLLASGCSQGILDTKWTMKDTAEKNSAAMQRVKPGMAFNEVVLMMAGEPYLVESYNGKNGEQILVNKYITRPSYDYSTIKEEDLTPVIFVNNVVEGLGWPQLETASKKYGFVVKTKK